MDTLGPAVLSIILEVSFVGRSATLLNTWPKLANYTFAMPRQPIFDIGATMLRIEIIDQKLSCMNKCMLFQGELLALRKDSERISR